MIVVLLAGTQNKNVQNGFNLLISPLYPRLSYLMIAQYLKKC